VTFAIVARCERTGQLGAACTTSDLAIGARVPWARAGVGAAVTQHRTDPRLGPRLLELLASGCDAAGALAGTVASTSHARWRQLAVIGRAGPPSAWSGALVEPGGAAEIVNDDHAVVGNVLVGPAVGHAVSAGFWRSPGELAERLVAALEAGAAAGGERYPLRSAALLVVADQPFPLVDLRVDAHADPVAELRRLWGLYRPQVNDFVCRALDPEVLP
jgi:uncharacterized Ntn-hydrolase superfamily protein